MIKPKGTPGSCTGPPPISHTKELKTREGKGVTQYQ